MAYIKLNAVVNLAVRLLFSTLLCCRLLVNLTQPTYLCFGNEYPLLQGKEKKDPETVRSFMEVDHYLRDYKEVCSSVENTDTHTHTCTHTHTHTHTHTRTHTHTCTHTHTHTHTYLQTISIYVAMLSAGVY